MDGTKQAIVLKVGDRFYNKHTNKRVTTAWSLAGAKLFLDGTGLAIQEAEIVLKKKGYTPIRAIIQIVLDVVPL